MEALLATLIDVLEPDDVRILPLRVSRGYRDVGSQVQTLQYRRRAGCMECTRGGCSACGWVGWVVRDEALEIALPDGCPLGSHLRIADRGDESPNPSRATRALVVEIVEPGARADLLANAEQTYAEGLAMRWQMERTQRRRVELRRRIALTTLVLGTLAAAVAELLRG